MDPLISAENVTKKFGDFTAVDGVSLTIGKGECFGLLGPNGAGKSTFIGMLYGINRRHSGRLAVFGLDPGNQAREIKKRIGVVTQENALDESLTVEENMLLYAAFKGMPKERRRPEVLELLQYMSLDHKKGAPIRALSGGMQRRLVFVRALLGTPDLVILDEPTTGLDPAVRHLLWAKIKELKEGGTSVLLTTHYMHEAEILCDRLAVMNLGKVIAEGSPRQMISRHMPGFVGIFSKETEIQKKMGERASRFEVYSDSSADYVRAESLQELVKFHDQGAPPLQIRPSNLEDVFLKLTGQELSADA
jgi:lipooligosaccharide transport system ATP-binding protein